MSFLQRRKTVKRPSRGKITEVLPTHRTKATERRPEAPESVFSAKPDKSLIAIKENRLETLPVISDVTVVIVNFKTLKLTREAHSTMRGHYDVPILLVDNASGDGSTTFVRKHGGIINDTNIGHGPAMHRAIQAVKTRYVLTLDSDCIVDSGGWLEEMLAFFADPLAYAIGWRRWVDRHSGVPREWHLDKPPPSRFVQYIHPAVGLYCIEKYKKLDPFIHHGAPALQNMVDAEKKGYKVKAFPVFKYVTHLVAGTRRMYGGHWNPKRTDKPKRWKAKSKYPI